MFRISLYTHWAVYIGPVEGIPRVIHFSTPDGDFGAAEAIQARGSVAAGSGLILGTDKAGVRCDELEFVAGKDELRVNNSMDRYQKHFETNVILQKAQDMLGVGNYSLVANNCEHFAKFCRYGEKDSEQVSTRKRAAVSAAVLIVALPAGIAGLPALGAVTLGAVASAGTAAVWEIGHRVKRSQAQRKLYGTQ